MKRGRCVALQPLGYQPKLPVGTELPMPLLFLRLGEGQLKKFEEELESRHGFAKKVDEAFEQWRTVVGAYKAFFTEEQWSAMCFDRQRKSSQIAFPHADVKQTPELRQAFQKARTAHKRYKRAEAANEAFRAGYLMERLFGDTRGENIAAVNVWASHNRLWDMFDLSCVYSFNPKFKPCTEYCDLKIKAGDRFYFTAKIKRYLHVESPGWMVLFEITAHRVLDSRVIRRRGLQQSWDPHPIARFYSIHDTDPAAWEKVEEEERAVA